MSDRIERFKRRQAIKKASKKSLKIPELIDVKSISTDLFQKADTRRIDLCISKLEESYGLECNKFSISDDEVDGFIDRFSDKNEAIDAFIEPAFMSLIDGSLRAFKLGTKQGLTASRIYNECKKFSYEKTEHVNQKVDSFTENLNERDYIEKFNNKSEYRAAA